MKHLKTFLSALTASALLLCLSPCAHATSRTYIDDTASTGSNTAALIAAFVVIVLIFAVTAVVVKLGKSGLMNVSWAVLSVVFTGLALLLCLMGSSVGSLYSGTSGDPSETVSRFYDAVISGDYTTAYSCLSDYTGLGLEAEPGTENAVLIYNALKESYEYTLVGSAKVDKLTATQNVRFKYLDLSSLEASVADGVQRNLESIVKERSHDEIYDEHDNYLTSVTQEAYDASLSSVISHATSYYTSAELEIELSYTNGRWLIVTSQDMLNALMGGVAY